MTKTVLLAVLLLSVFGMAASGTLTVKDSLCQSNGCMAKVEMNGHEHTLMCFPWVEGCKGPLSVGGTYSYDVLNDSENPYHPTGKDAIRVHGETSNAIYSVEK